MQDRSFRFIHASDFWLDVPVAGLTDISDQLCDVLIDAPYRAAERVFEAACTEQVDMLILAGNILNPQCTDLRGPLFLVEQFRHLATQGIAVYWAGGRYDTPENWSRTFELPENVTFFPQDRVEAIVHRRDETTQLAMVQGISRGKSQRQMPIDTFDADPEGLFTIGVASYVDDPHEFKGRGLDYCAFGGMKHRRMLPGSSPIMNWSGSTLGRSPEDTGSFGFSLVEVENHRAQVQFVPINNVRWHTERVLIENDMSRDDLLLHLMERLDTLRPVGTRQHTVISWQLEGNAHVLMELARDGFDGNDATRLMLGELQESADREFNTSSNTGANGTGANNASTSPTSGVWNADMKIQPTDMQSHALYQQKNILSDYLQTIGHYEMNPDEPIDLASFMPSELQDGPTARFARFESESVRNNILREAAMLGVDLLSGEGS